MKKVILTCTIVAGLLGFNSAKAQLVDEKNVTITMDLQPILQLDMTGPQNIDFVFDQISEYVGGITQYGVTQLKINSTVGWDLYAVGYGSSGTTWDQQVEYGSGTSLNASGTLPCSLLEIRQDKANPFPGTATDFADYNSAFVTSPVTTGANNIYVSATPYVAPADGEKYIAGGATAVATAFVPGGTYMVLSGGNVGSGSNYWYNIDYRIVPGLPAVFPNAATNAGVSTALASPAYAQPGVYTMNVKYVLVEN
jgi:hypothetical protein